MLLRIRVRDFLVLEGSLAKAVVAGEATWTFEPGEVHLMLPKSDVSMWGKLFPSEERLNPGVALKQVCDDEPYQGSYMDLSPEARQIVDLHRNYRHAQATGKVEWAAELEEEMKLMQFRWADGEPF